MALSVARSNHLVYNFPCLTRRALTVLVGLFLLSITGLEFPLDAALAAAGPVEFGMEEFQAAAKAKGLTISLETEINLDQPETFRIVTVKANVVRVTGGDLRGLMYGLIEAGDQIRNTGKVTATTGTPGLAERGVRLSPTDGELASAGFYASERWRTLFRMLGKNRLDRFTLVLPQSQLQGDRIRYLSRTASESGVDFILGLRGSLDSRTLYGQLRQILEQDTSIRGLQLQGAREPMSLFQSAIFPALRSAGRRVTLDLHDVDSRPDLVSAAAEQGIALRVGSARPAKGTTGVHTTIQAPEGGAGADIEAIRSRVVAVVASGSVGLDVEIPGPNIERYERFYWAWGRASYDAKGLNPAASGIK